MPSAATQVTSSSGATWPGSRLLVHSPSRSGVSGRSMTHGACACSRTQTWPSAVEHVGEPVVQRAQRAAGVAPQVPAVPDVRAQRRDVADEDRDVDVLVLARAPR